MAREVVSPRDTAMTRGGRPAEESPPMVDEAEAVPQAPDSYKERILKYIPGEVVAVYVAVDAAVRSMGDQAPPWLAWAVFLFMWMATPVYLMRVMKVGKTMQLGISTLAFAVWVFAIGGPFTSIDWYSPMLGAVVLPLYTFVVALVEA